MALNTICVYGPVVYENRPDYALWLLRSHISSRAMK